MKCHVLPWKPFPPRPSSACRFLHHAPFSSLLPPPPASRAAGPFAARNARARAPVCAGAVCAPDCPRARQAQGALRPFPGKGRKNPPATRAARFLLLCMIWNIMRTICDFNPCGEIFSGTADSGPASRLFLFHHAAPFLRSSLRRVDPEAAVRFRMVRVERCSNTRHRGQLVRARQNAEGRRRNTSAIWPRQRVEARLYAPKSRQVVSQPSLALQ